MAETVRIINVEFRGVECPQGEPIGGGWRILGDVRADLDAHLATRTDAVAMYAAATRCLKCQIQIIRSAVVMVHAYISIQHESGTVRHAVFFRGTGDGWNPRDGGDIANAASDALVAVGRGGVARLSVREFVPATTTEADRLQMCHACPSDAFDGAACRLFRCCKSREPDPARWRRALQSGVCPRGHWMGTTAAEALRFPMVHGHVDVGGAAFPTL